MKISECRKVYEAVCSLADLLGETEQNIVNHIAFFDETHYKKIRDAINEYQSFSSESVSKKLERIAKENGYEIEHSGEKTIVSTTL